MEQRAPTGAVLLSKTPIINAAVHDAHRAHGHAVQEVGGVLQGGNAASGGVAGTEAHSSNAGIAVSSASRHSGISFAKNR